MRKPRSVVARLKWPPTHSLPRSLSSVRVLALAAPALLYVACGGGSSENPAAIVPPVVVSTFAGNGEAGYRDGPVSQALFDTPEGVAVAGDGTVFVAETFAGRVRKIDPAGEVSTLLSGDQVKLPHRLATDEDGALYVSDAGNNRILKVTTAGDVSVLAGAGESGDRDGPADAALFNFPIGLGVRGDGAVVVADSGNSKIRAVLPSGEVVTIAGSGERGLVDGAGAAAQFSGLNELAVDSAGGIYVTEPANPAVRRIDTEGVVSTVAGGGEHRIDGGAESLFKGPAGIVVSADSSLAVADFGRHQLLYIDSNGNVAPLAGDGESGFVDGPGANARFNRPTGMVAGPDGALYIADAGNNALRRVEFTAARPE